MAQGLPSSLDAAYEEAESTTFTIPNEVEDQLKKQAQETARRNKASEQALELSPIPQDMGGASAGTGKVPYLSAFTQAAQKYNVPINVLIGLAEQESRFKPTALGTQTQWGRAKGLMQYLDSTAAGMGINPYDPVQSIDAAARQLRERLDKGYSMIDATREHFAGPDRKKWGTKTHNYGIEVMQRAQKYQNIGAPAPSAQPAAQQKSQPSANPDSSRYRPLSADEIKRIEQAKKEGKSEIVLQIGMKPIKLGNQNADPLVTDKNKDANFFTDTGNLLLSGVNKLGESARELSHRIPITKPTAMLLDKINEYFVGKTSEQIFAEADKHYAGKMSAPTAKARQKLWVVEPGDKLDDGTTAKGWNIGPAWKDPRAYYAGIVESVPELAVSMGGSLSLARGAFNTAIKSGATREAASKAAAKTATLAGSFIEGGLGGASSAVEVRKKINELPDNVLQQSDVIKELMNGGMTLAQAKKEVAEKSATKAFVLAGVGTGVFGGLGDRAIAKIITEGSSSRIKSALSGAVAEGVFEEMPQSAAQQLAQNYALQDADPNQRLMQGVANQAAGGLALGASMGGGIGAATHRAPQSEHGEQDQAPDVQPALTEEQVQIEQGTAPERKIGAIERAVNDGQDLDAAISAEIEAVTGQDNIEQLINQPNATPTDEGTSTATAEQWLGAPGTEVQVSPKEDPSSVYTVRVEGYQNGEVFARDADGTPIQFGQDDIVSASPVNVPESVTEDVKVESTEVPTLTDFGVTPAETKPATQADANLSSFEEITPQAAPDTQKAEPVEIESPEKTLAKMDEAELRARIKYLADQAKASGGWNKRLMEERRKVETQINKNQEQKIDDKPYFKWEGMSPAERMAAAEKAGINADTARDISSKAWGAIDKSITDQLTAKPAPKPKATKAPEVKQPEAKKPEADYSDAVPEQKQAATQEAAPFRQLIIDAHFNNPPMKAQLIQQEIKTGRPRHEVMKDVQGIVADIKAGKITAPAAAPQATKIEGKDLGDGWSEFSRDSGTIGIPRADMPQIKAEHRGAMVNFMNARGINHKEDTVAADSLKPTQKEFSREKVKKASEREGGDRSILVSKDGHVLDGHHQWMAAREKGEDVKVIRLDAPIKDLVDAAHEFPSSTVDENAAAPTQAENQSGERGPLLGADGNPKWFMSQEKAQAFIEKKKLTDQYRVQKVDNRRFEIHPIATDTQEATASNAAPTVVETKQPESKQTVTQWKEDMQEALAKADPDHPLYKKLQASAKNGLKSENDRQVALRQALEIEKQEQPAPKSQPSDFIQVISVSDKKAPTAEQIVEKAAEKAKPSANTLVSDDRAAELRARLKAKLNQLNSGIDPEILAIGAELAVYHIERGARTFTAFAKNVAADLDVSMDKVRPYLRSWYNGARDMIEDMGGMIEGMDSAETVRSELAKLTTTEENQNARTVQSENVPAGDQGGTQGNVTTGNRDSEPLAAGVAETSESTDRGEPVSNITQGAGGSGTRGVQPEQSAPSTSRDSGTVRTGLSSADALGEGDTVVFSRDYEYAVAGQEYTIAKKTGAKITLSRDGAQTSLDVRLLNLALAKNLEITVTPQSKTADPATAETSPKPEIDQPADFDLANEEIGKGGLTKKYKDNIASIRILKAMQAESRLATPEERKQIARYVGWGALKGVFDKDNKQWSKEYAELKELLTDAEYKAARASVRNAFYTSPLIVNSMYAALQRMGFDAGRVLEPSVGVGNFFGLMPADMRKKSQLHGVELDPLTSQIAAALYPSAKIAQATGFQDYQVPSEYFDVAIGNPPFGEEPIVDNDRSPYSGSSIHNYFFAKSIDKVRPGGLMVMVVSSSFMDAKNNKTRKWIADRADLVGAVRLPSNAFKENAGTEVITDILVFQKPIDGIIRSNTSWVDVGSQTITNSKTGETVAANVNNHFINNPQDVLGDVSADSGMYGGNNYTVKANGDVGVSLMSWTKGLPQKLYKPIERTHEPEGADVSVPDGVKVGSFFVGDNGAISVRGPDAMGNRTATEWTAPNAKAAERMKGMIGLRDSLREQMRLEKSPDTTTEQIEANRTELNRQYDDFNKQYGFLNDQTNRRLFLDDTESALLLALEFDYDKGVSKAVAAREEIDPRNPSAVKADIFNRRVMYPPADNIKVSNAKDALLASLNYKARLDLPYMASLYDKTEAEIIQELGDVVYNDPINGYVMADEYLSGDVKTKLAEAQEAAKDNPDFKRNVEALKKVIPVDKLPSEIHAALGASFIPAELFEQFAKEVTGADHRVGYVKATGQWVIDPRGQTNDSLNVGKWGIAKMPATAIFARTMAGQGVVVTETVRLGGGKTETRVLEKETEAAREKQAALKAEWQRWLWSDPDRADRVASIYNEKMNRIVVRKYDGDHMTFPGMSPAIQLLEHQKNAVWRALQSRQVLLDHTVGAGKTFEIVALFMEMRRLGIARKPFIAVPNHLTLQWRSEFSRLYPAANVLAATPEDFSKGNREKFFSKIVTGDWDAVIVGHSSLKKISLPPETEKAVLEEQINEIADAIDQMKRERGDRNIIRDMEGIRARLAARMTQRVQNLGERDKVVTFDELGVDAFAIDELHEFKNLFYNSTMERVPGMGNPAGSDKAFDLFVKLQWMFNTFGDKAPIAGATGTPVSNSLVEMFNMQRLLQYPTLKKDSLHVFDAWAKQFGSVESLYEVAPSGTGYRQSSRFAKFKNLPALMSHYQTFADTVTLDDLKAQEEAQGKAFPVPKVFGGRPQNIVAKRSPNVASFMGTPELDIQDGHVQFGFNVAAGDRFEVNKSEQGDHLNVMIVQEIDGAEVTQHLGTAKTEEDARLMLVEQALSPKIHVDPKSILGQFSNLKELNKKTKGKVNALSLTGQANKAGLDYRLVDPTAPDFAGSKINMAVDRMMTTYHKWSADKGTQLIFCDLSVPKSARSGFGSKERRVYVRDEKGGIVHKKGTLHTAEGFEDLPHLVIKEGKEFAIYDAATGLRIRGQLPSKAVALEWTKQTLSDEAKRQRWIDARDDVGDLDQDAIDDYNNANEINTEETEAISLSDIAGASGAAGFSVYDDIKTKLIAKGVPEREIAFIHDYSTPVAKDKLFKAVNSGAIRFLLGSTPKMGAGTNVQKRLVGLHHIDAPWRPSDLEQREGRIIRRGNTLYERDPSGFEIEIYRYATEQTYDTRRWQILEHKSRGIEQLRNYDGSVNEIDDIEGEAANAADMKAAASGDPLILEETQLRNDVRRLESLQAAHADSTQMLFRRARDNQRFADEIGPRALEEFHDLQATADKNPVKKDQFAGLTMNGRKIADREDAVKAIQKEMVRVFAGGSDASFTYRGIEFTLDNTLGYVELNSPTGRLDSFDPSKDSLPSAAGFLTRFANYIARIPAHIDDLNAKIAEAQRDAVELREQANSTFAQADELTAAREAHKRVQRRLIAKGPDIPAKQKTLLDKAMEAQKSALRDQGLGDAMDEFVGSRQNSRGQAISTGTTVTEVREALVNRFGEKTIAKLEKGGTLNIIDVLNETGVEGFTAGGKVTLVADALTTETIVPVFLHELGGHVGFQGVMKPQAQKNLMDQFNKLVAAKDPIALEAKRLAEREADAAAQQAEYLPYLVTVAARTQNKRPGIRNLIARIVSAVKAWAVDRLGMNISLNANDVLALAERMVSRVSQSQGDRDISTADVKFSRADDDLGTVSQAEYDSKLNQWWKEAKQLPSDALTNSMRGWGLGLVPLRPMLKEIAKDIPAAQTYLRVKDKMDALRNEWHAKVDAVAQDWLKYRIKNREENRELMDIMHESTLEQVDPSMPFQSLMTPKEVISLKNPSMNANLRAELTAKMDLDAKREEAYDKLKIRYDDLSPEARSIFEKVRDAYSDMADAFDETLLNNMEKAINVRIRKAEREYKREIERIKDEGMEGTERDNAVADAERTLKNAKTKIAWNRKARLTQLRQQFETQRLAGPYFPLARFGQLFVTVRDAKTGEIVSFSRFEKAQEQRRFADEMKQDKNHKVEVGALADAEATRKAVDPNFVADVEDILADLPNAEQIKDEVWQRYLESLPDMSIRKSRIHRKGRAGYISDAVRAFGHHLFHGSHQLARMTYSMDLEDALDQARDESRETKDPTRSALVVNEMDKRHQFVMNPTGGQLATWASSFAFVWYLAGSPKAALMNLFQTPIMGIPILAAYDGQRVNSIVRAGNQLSRALIDFTQGKGYAMRSSRLTAEERDAMEKGYETGIIEKTQGHELAGVAENGVEYNAMRERVMKVISWGFHHTERLNREVTFLAAYRIARNKGVPHEQAISDAGDLTWKAHFDYSNTSRPRLMHSDTMKILLVFRNFQLNMLFRLFRDVHQAMHGDSKEARREALTQLAGITGMMMLNAGITGTWLFGIAMLMAGLFLGDGEDPEEELKKGMVNILGPNLAGLALYGVPGHVTGTALSESVGMPDLWFRSPDSEKEGEEAMNFWVSQLLGAVPAIATQMFRGVSYIKKGEEYRGIETMLPKMLKDPMKSYRYATEGAKNMKGDTVADVRWTDVVKQASGFTPARISEQYKINNLNYNKQQLILKSRKQLMDDYYKATQADDEKAVDEVISKIEKHNEKNPDQPITAKGLIQSAKTRQKGSENAVGGMRYNNKLRERILEDQAPSIYK